MKQLILMSMMGTFCMHTKPLESAGSPSMNSTDTNISWLDTVTHLVALYNARLEFRLCTTNLMYTQWVQLTTLSLSKIYTRYTRALLMVVEQL